MWRVTGLPWAIVRMAETVAGAVDVRAAVADAIVDAAGAVDGLAVADGIADAAGQAGEDTKNHLPRIYTDLQGYKRGPRRESRPFLSCPRFLNSKKPAGIHALGFVYDEFRA